MARVPVLVLAALLLLGTNASAQERPEPAAKDATVFGFKLHYLEIGRGQPVILLHGTGGEGARWMPTIRQNSESSRRIRSASGSPTSRSRPTTAVCSQVSLSAS